MTIPPTVGLVLGVIVVVLCVLGILAVIPFSGPVVFALVGITALARIV